MVGLAELGGESVASSGTGTEAEAEAEAEAATGTVTVRGEQRRLDAREHGRSDGQRN
jgi:hypothetical protein